jgi:Phosphate-selective porin O and P
MTRNRLGFLFGACAVIILGLCVLPAHAGVNVWQKDDSYVDVGLLIQTQARAIDGGGAGTNANSDGVFFRRLRPFFYGAFNKNWQGIIQMDFGQGFEGQDAKTSVKWAYMEYLGFEANQQSSLKIGSFKPYFGREFLTLGPHLQTIERTFAGIQWYGTPDYMMGIGFTRLTPDRKMSYGVTAGTMSINQRPDRIFFQSPQNQTSGNDNTGYLVSGRLDFYPFGEMPFNPKPLTANAFDRSDLHNTQVWQVMMSVGGYGWWNNNDSNHGTTVCPLSNNNVCPSGLADVNQVYGGEVSGGLRGYGFSGDVEYQRIHSDLRNATFTGGLYSNGTTDLNKFTVNGGYMIYRDKVELAGSYALMSASNFASNMDSYRAGLNWFVHEYAIRFSADITFNTNAYGTTGAWENVGRLQAQFAW